MISNVLLYTILLTFVATFALDLASTIRAAWVASAQNTEILASSPEPALLPLLAATETTPDAPSFLQLPDPWDISTAKPAAAAVPTAPTALRPQLLLAPAKETAASPATIASKPPQTSVDYNSVLTVDQLRRKARAAEIKNFGRMRKNQLLTLLASA